MEKYFLNNYRSKQFGKDFLIVTDHGSFVFLNEQNFNLLKNENFKDGELFRLLEEKGIIITEKNKKEILTSIKKRRDFLYNGVSLHIIIPTLRCNQKCVYCHASSNPLDQKGCDMDKETAKKTVDFIFQSPSKHVAIEFQGGEPLLNFEIVEYVIKYAKDLNKKYGKDLIFRIVSNLTLLDDYKLDFLIKEGVGICTSLDGPEFLHDKNRPFLAGGKSYSIVSKKIKDLVQIYKKRNIKFERANALITITNDSLKYPKEIIDEYIKLGLSEIHLRFLNNLGDARPVWSDIAYSPEQFIEFWKKSLDYILELNKKGIFFRERSSLIIIQKILTESDPNFLDIRSPCGAAIGQLSYTPQGKIFSCDEARMVGEDLFNLGSVKNDNYKEVVSSPQTCALVSSSMNEGYICDYCVYKPYCGICPVCNFVEQGTIIAKIPETARCKIYKEQFSYIFNKVLDPKNKSIFLDWLNKDNPENEEKREQFNFSKS
jgi:His-Xaa-Ser system radical SAM maturase HxsB